MTAIITAVIGIALYVLSLFGAMICGIEAERNDRNRNYSTKAATGVGIATIVAAVCAIALLLVRS